MNSHDCIFKVWLQERTNGVRQIVPICGEGWEPPNWKGLGQPVLLLNFPNRVHSFDKCFSKASSKTTRETIERIYQVEVFLVLLHNTTTCSRTLIMLHCMHQAMSLVTDTLDALLGTTSSRFAKNNRNKSTLNHISFTL